jgi:hypothetical protein
MGSAETAAPRGREHVFWLLRILKNKGTHIFLQAAKIAVTPLQNRNFEGTVHHLAKS